MELQNRGTAPHSTVSACDTVEEKTNSPTAASDDAVSHASALQCFPASDTQEEKADSTQRAAAEDSSSTNSSATQKSSTSESKESLSSPVAEIGNTVSVKAGDENVLQPGETMADLFGNSSDEADPSEQPLMKRPAMTASSSTHPPICKRPAKAVADETASQSLVARGITVQTLCEGRETSACEFGVGGAPAKVRQMRCAFCDKSRMKDNLLIAKERATLINKYQTFAAPVQIKALNYVPVKYRAQFRRPEAHRIANPETTTQRMCSGRVLGEPCEFGAKGARAKVRRGQCVFCDQERMKEGLLVAKERAQIVRKFQAFAVARQATALAYVPLEYRAHFQTTVNKLRCRGLPQRPCIFKQNGCQEPAKALRAGLCYFCHAPSLSLPEEGSDAQKEGLFRKLHCLHPEAREVVLEERLPGEVSLEYRRSLQPAQRPKRQRLPKRLSVADQEVAYSDEVIKNLREEGCLIWKAPLAGRQAPRRFWSPTESQVYRSQVLEDRAKSRRVLKQPKKRVKPEEEVDNDTDLPPAKRSRLATDIENWCRYNSWSICSSCKCLNARKMTESSLGPALSPTISHKQCAYCTAQQEFKVPSVESIPHPLRELSPAVCQALSPFEIDCGKDIRARGAWGQEAGYRLHANMIRFSWHATSVEKRLSQLPRGERQAGKDAFQFMLENEKASYQHYHKEHHKFLQLNPEADDRQRKRWLRTLEEQGIECALWPHLFWDDEMTLTWVRLQSPQRRSRRQQIALEDVLAGDPLEQLEDDAEVETEGQSSIKRLYQALVTSSVIGYGSTYEFLHFAFDLHLWTSLGSKKNMNKSDVMPLRLMMAGFSFTQIYWQRVTKGLLDLVRQRGLPALYFTHSPWEHCLAYHEALRDEMRKSHVPRLHCPVFETLHTTHVLKQCLLGVLTGTQRVNGRPWSRHILRTDEDVTGFHRIEFQDGSRKAVTQAYHGSGRPHSHSLLFADDLEKLMLHLSVLATLPDDDPVLRSFMEASQCDHTGKSMFEEEDAENRWDPELGAYVFKHTASDKAAGLRAVFVELFEGLKGCHQDLQVADPYKLLEAYVTKYSSKFSDSFMQDLMNDDADGDGVAASVLARYHPCEPEMVLLMFGGKFQPWHINTANGGKRDFVVPVPDKEPMPAEVEQYENCSWKWRGDVVALSLLEFLRKSNGEGEVCHWLVKKHAQHVESRAFELFQETHPEKLQSQHAFVNRIKKQRGELDFWTAALEDLGLLHQGCPEEPMSLTDFARDYVMRGEKVVAADTVSRTNDKFYGQWLILHVPFDTRADFFFPRVEDLVPAAHRYLGMALCCTHPLAATWRDASLMTEEMRKEACTPKFRDAVHAAHWAQKALVEDYLEGRLVQTITDADAAVTEAAPARRQHRCAIQRRFEDMLANGTKDVEGRLNLGAMKKVRAGDELHLGSVGVLVKEVRMYNSFADMLQDLGFARAVPDVITSEEALAVYHSFKNYEQLAESHGVLAFILEPWRPATTTAKKAPEWHIKQKQFISEATERCDRALAVANATSQEACDVARKACFTQNSILVCEGPPGTGKTTVAEHVVQYVLEREGKVLFVCLTAQGAVRMKKKWPGGSVAIDTCHAALGLDEDPINAAYALWPFTMVVIDEISLLNDKQFEHIDKLHKYIDRAVALIVLGDRRQMAMQGKRPWESPVWRQCYKVTLVKPFRCQDEHFWKLLSGIRTVKPLETDTGNGVSVPSIMRGPCLGSRSRRAWPHHTPTVEDIRRLLTKHPGTTLMAISRVGTDTLNQLSVAALFSEETPLHPEPLAGDYEANPENYEKGQKKPVEQWQPYPLWIYKGMQIYFTRNVNKSIDFVNGVRGTIEAYDVGTKGLRIITETNHRVVVWPWTDKDNGNLTYYPVRPGYASTIVKFQGAELEHLIVWLDKPGIPGAAYTAMSRVREGKNCLIGGDVKALHFMPAL